jgi:hypothetical protein
VIGQRQCDTADESGRKDPGVTQAFKWSLVRTVKPTNTQRHTTIKCAAVHSRNHLSCVIRSCGTDIRRPIGARACNACSIGPSPSCASKWWQRTTRHPSLSAQQYFAHSVHACLRMVVLWCRRPAGVCPSPTSSNTTGMPNSGSAAADLPFPSTACDSYSSSAPCSALSATTVSAPICCHWLHARSRLGQCSAARPEHAMDWATAWRLLRCKQP